MIDNLVPLLRIQPSKLDLALIPGPDTYYTLDFRKVRALLSLFTGMYNSVYSKIYLVGLRG